MVSGDRGSVLVVDDNIDAADLLAALLESRGYAVRVAHDGHAALAAVAVALPDIVVLDLALPGVDGLEVARRIRAAHPGGKPRIVAVSGHGTAQHHRATQAAGFDVHLVKPIRLAELLAALAG